MSRTHFGLERIEGDRLPVSRSQCCAPWASHLYSVTSYEVLRTLFKKKGKPGYSCSLTAEDGQNHLSSILLIVSVLDVEEVEEEVVVATGVHQDSKKEHK